MIAEGKAIKPQPWHMQKPPSGRGYPGTERQTEAIGIRRYGADYNTFPPSNKSSDLLQLGGFSMPPFPKSVEEWKALDPIWKQFRRDIDQQMKPLQKMTEESNKVMVKQLESQQKQFMDAMHKAGSNPGSVSQAGALAIVAAPMFSEEMNARQNIVLQNLQKKKQAALRKMSEFVNGDGAALKRKVPGSNEQNRGAVERRRTGRIGQR